MVKKWLGAKGFTWEEVNVEEFPERAKEAFEVSGQLAVPVTVVTHDNDEQDVIIGYNLAKLAPALA
jgi:glutaredoxin